MNIKDFMAAMQAIENDRQLSKEIVVEALEEALCKAYRKHIEIPDALVRVDIDAGGEIHVFQERQIVEEVEDDELEISLADAKRIDQTLELGGMVDEEVSFENFGRAAVVLAKNVMKQKIREAEKLVIYEEYIDKVQEMVHGTIESVEERFCIVNIGKTMALMLKKEQIPGENYTEGERIRVVISEVNRESKGAQVMVSRADSTLVKRLFEREVPEIYQGIVEIKAIARDAGERTKMAVYSTNENVDPIGACIGPGGARVQMVIEELHGEKIDIFEWSDDVSELIKNALSPADVFGVLPNEERREGLTVVVPDTQLSLAIGKKGKNARLAVKLTGHKIDIKSETDMETIEPNWRAKAEAFQQEFASKKQVEAQAAQEAAYAESIVDGVESIQEEDFNISDDVIETVEEVATETPVEEVVEPIVEEVKEELDEMEEAARLAKELQKQQGTNIKEKQAYVSKFEKIAGAPATPKEEPVRRRRYRDDDRDKEEKRTASIDLSSTDYEMKPIYTEQELDEIKEQQNYEEDNDWINDEIDFDEFDKYYDEE